MNLLSLCEWRLNRNVKHNLELLMKLQATRSQRKTQSQPTPAVEIQVHAATAGAAATTAAEEHPKAA